MNNINEIWILFLPRIKAILATTYCFFVSFIVSFSHHSLQVENLQYQQHASKQASAEANARQIDGE